MPAVLETIGFVVLLVIIGIGVFYFIRNYLGNNWPKNEPK